MSSERAGAAAMPPADNLHTAPRTAEQTAGAQKERSLYLEIAWPRALVGGILLLGAGIRFFALDYYPLSTVESAYAWAAWQIGQGIPARPEVANPLFFSVQTLLFWLVGGNDYWARVVDAGAGIGVLVGLAAWRLGAGRYAGLILLGLAALSPWLVELARTGTGDTLAFALGLALLVLLHKQMGGGRTRAAEARAPEGANVEPERGPIRWVAGLLGLLAVAGPWGLNFLVLGSIWAWMERKRLDHLIQAWRYGAPTFLAAIVLGATGWLARPDGVGNLSSELGAWVAQFGFTPATLTDSMGMVARDSAWVLGRVLHEQALVVTAGTIGLALLFWRVRRPTSTPDAAIDLAGVRLLAVWYILGLVLLLAPGRSTAALAFFVMPCLLGLAWWLAALTRRVPRDVDRGELWVVGGTLLVLLAAAWIWSTVLLAATVLQVTLIQALLAILGLVVVLFVLVGFWTGRKTALWLAGWMLLVACLLGSGRTTWLAGFADLGSVQPSAGGSATHADIRLMVADLETISAQQTGDPHKLRVRLERGLLNPVMAGENDSGERDFSLLQVYDPVLRWYLRDFRSTVWPEQIPPRQPGEPIAYVLPDGDASALRAGLPADANYVETDYALRAIWRGREPSALDAGGIEGMTGTERIQAQWRTVWRPAARWLVFGEPMSPPLFQRVDVGLVFHNDAGIVADAIPAGNTIDAPVPADAAPE